MIINFDNNLRNDLLTLSPKINMKKSFKFINAVLLELLQQLQVGRRILSTPIVNLIHFQIPFFYSPLQLCIYKFILLLS